ncbi:hypothetical protein [Prolixibacter sp. NT017]|uniref:hypothetical protein n=1 Tax=Prolixibacter sp. NT017 TaxID=2652390 RepID=UPI001298EC34|nr:hypothetical protein [Prolixibacter sp. NT017]
MNTKNNISDKYNHLLDINRLMSGLKKEDARNVRISRIFQWLMGGMSLLYLLVFVVNPDHDLTWGDRVGGVCYVVGFLVFAIIFKGFQDEYKSIDYGLPTMVMLKKAAERYRLFQPKKLYALIPVLLVDMGLVFHSLDGHQDGSMSIWDFQLFYLACLVGGLGVGIMIWRVKQKPLRDAARELLREIESE